MASPEGGFWGFIKNLFSGEKSQPKIQKSQTKVNSTKTPEEKREKKDKADLLLKELERITPQHRAYEFLRGITFDRTALSQNNDLANVLLDILRINDPNLYHDPAWLKKTQERLFQLEQSPQIPYQLQQNVSIVTRRVETMLQKAETHRRRIEIEKELQQKEWMSDEAIEVEKKRVEEFGGRKASEPIIPEEEDLKDWSKTIEELPENILSQQAKNYAQAIKEGKLSDKDHNYAGELYRELNNAHKDIIKRINKTAGASSVDQVNGPMKEEFDKAQKDSEKLNSAWEKTARHVVEMTGSESGRLFEALRSPQGEFIEKQIRTDANYRDYWFYHILEPILYNKQGDGHRELYNLYVAGDMDSFLEIIRHIKDPSDPKLGIRIAQRYDILKNTLFQSHDMDYYAAHPQQEMKEFIGSIGLFVNKYIDAAHQDPLVSMAKRAYETALLQIRDINNKYIPREWLTWEEGKLRASKLDELADAHVRQWIDAGQLFQIKTDDVTGTGLPSPSIWNRKQIDPNRPFTLQELNGYESPLSDEWRASLGDLKIAAALKQAKGLALVDQRLLEIISQSRGTGTEYEQSGDVDESFSLAARQFNSIPYEGIVRHINPIIHYYSRYRMGGEYYDAFFNMLVLDRWEKWDPEIMKKVVEFHVKGDHEGAIGYLQSIGLKDAAGALKSRLDEKQNPFEYSGIWGPWTSWRLGDASISFDDWEREQAYGTNVKLTTAGGWAERQARRHFEKDNPQYREYRLQFRNHSKESDNIYWREAAIRDEAIQRTRPDDFDDEFEAIWRKTGKDLKDPASTDRKTYRQLLDDLWHANQETYEDMINQLRIAYVARTWVQATMRSPLLVARYIDNTWNKDGYTVQTPLQKKIIREILGIDIDEIAAMRTPKSKEEAGFDRVVELEGAVAAVSQTAIRENRDLRIEDFDRISDLTLRSYAKEYWRMVKEAMLGKFKTAEQFYKELGIGDPDKTRTQGARMHNIDWNKVSKVVSVTHEAKGAPAKYKLLFETAGITNNLLNRDYKTTLFSTEDMGWEYLNIGALGERNPVRRAGDLASHVQFAQLFEKYINDLLVARPKIEDFVEAQKEMWTALSGDFVDIAIRSCYRIAYTTAMMYRKADVSWEIPFASPVIGLFKDSSIMQMIRGKDRADAWGPNELLHYTQAVGGKQILPKREYHGLAAYAKLHEQGYAHKMGAQFKGFTSKSLGTAIGGTKGKATWEIISMTLMIATLLTVWRAFTAKSEEDEDK